VFWQGLWDPDGIISMVKSASISRPLREFRGDINLPYFGKMEEYWAYSSCESKRWVL
jgi:hypothetical protein